MNLKKYQNYFLAFPIILSIACLAALSIWGLKPGIDISGGSMIRVDYAEGRPDVVSLQNGVNELGYGEVRIQLSGENGFVFRQKVLSPEEKVGLDQTLATFGEYTEVQYSSIGPSIGAELVSKAWWAVGLVILSIVSYIAFAFRRASKPVPSWKYGMVSVAALVHDVLVPIGLFAFLGFYRGAEVGTLFIVALLTVLGVSINGSIVVFDRIRENLLKNEESNTKEPYVDVVWKSVEQTLGRTINTSLTLLIMLVALVILGPESTRDFALTLTVGMFVGTYSSVFLAAPLLVLIEKYQKPAKEKKN